MNNAEVRDAIVVGSGISASMVAHALVEAGLSVTMLDIGYDDTIRDEIPDRSFDDLRRSDENQRSYFLGRNYEGLPKAGVRVGAQLTPPRQFLHRESENLFPSESSTFWPLQPASLGGLGAGWGAACFTFDSDELRKAGIDDPEFTCHYQRASDIVGISADPRSPANQRLWNGVVRHQPPLVIDSNAETILKRAERKAGELAHCGMTVGRIPMAILSEDKPPRRANPYHDMDFYSDARMSIFRPRYLIAELLRSRNFHYVPRRLALRFEDRGGHVVVFSKDVDGGGVVQHSARRVVLCAGALNSARIALHSLGLYGVPTTILCNPYTYFPTVNLAMLGREARDRRHSMAQFGGTLNTQDAADVYGCFQMYSYRSLLMFKLVKEMPLPASLGRMVCRTLLNSFAIFGIFFADTQSESKRLEVVAGGSDSSAPLLRMDYQASAAETTKRSRHEAIFTKMLRRLRCFPIGRFDPGNAGSIHYAGTIPFDNPITPRFHSNPDYSIEGAKNVFAGDGAPWNYLPAKGLSFTLMANGLRVARSVMDSLRREL